MTEPMDIAAEYALHKAMHKKIFKSAYDTWRAHLEQHGHNEKSLEEVESNVIAMMESLGVTELDTEFGKIVIESSDIYLHKNSTVISVNKSLSLKTKKD